MLKKLFVGAAMLLTLFAFAPQSDANGRCFNCASVNDVALAGGGSGVSTPNATGLSGGLAVSQGKAKSTFYSNAEACAVELSGGMAIQGPDGVLVASGSLVAGGSSAFSHPNINNYSFFGMFCTGAEVNGFGVALGATQAQVDGFSASTLGVAAYSYNANTSGAGRVNGSGVAAQGGISSVQIGPNSVRVTAMQGSIASSSSSARSKSGGFAQ